MRNPRGAGRKPKLSEEQYKELKSRLAAGEKVSALSEYFGISRQAIYRKLQNEKDPEFTQINLMEQGEIISSIRINPENQLVRVLNYTARLSKSPFGWNQSPGWDDLERFLEAEYLSRLMPDEQQSFYRDLLCMDAPAQEIPLSALEQENTFQVQPDAGSFAFRFTRKDILYTRTDTDGFQMKALSADRKWFVKSQAVIAGKRMEDWKVEAIASDLCRQLSIPHVEQFPCRLFYEQKPYMGVCSRNFELDGYTFVSFERLLERSGKTSRDEEFIHLDALEKMDWCAIQLAEAGRISPDLTKKYMLDLALIDCLVGNTDRHTRNFGLFFCTQESEYAIPLIFDNGMGLFEHDYYNDTCSDFEEAMRTVYVEPYGEDPFDLLQLLMEHFDLDTLYPGLRTVTYASYPLSGFAEEYQRRILQLLHHTA